jgi:hypothetical protein
VRSDAGHRLWSFNLMMMLAAYGAKAYQEAPRTFGATGMFAHAVEVEKGGKSARLAILRLPLPGVYIATGLVGFLTLAASLLGLLRNDIAWAIFCALGYWPAGCGFAWIADSFRFFRRGEEWAALLDSPKGRRHTAILSLIGAFLAAAGAILTVLSW